MKIRRALAGLVIVWLAWLLRDSWVMAGLAGIVGLSSLIWRRARPYLFSLPAVAAGAALLIWIGRGLWGLNLFWPALSAILSLALVNAVVLLADSDVT